MFRKRLEEAMSMRNMTAAELSRRSGVSEGMISSYRSGQFTPKSARIYVLAEALNVSPQWLMGIDGPNYEEMAEEVAMVFNSLSTDRQEQALAYLHFLLTQQDIATIDEASHE